MDGYYLLCLPPQKTGVEISIIPRFNNINWRGDESSSETCCRSCREMAGYAIFKESFVENHFFHNIINNNFSNVDDTITCDIGQSS